MANIIFLNGTPSSGKTSIAKELQTQLTTPFWHFASDQLVEADILPERKNNSGPFDWSINRPKFFDAFHACIVAIASTGNNIILDHVLESQQWHDDILKSLSDHDVFFVGVHCPIEILREREKNRDDHDIGNRYLGEAEYHLRNVHSYGVYDYEIDSSLQSPKESASLIMRVWQDRSTISEG